MSTKPLPLPKIERCPFCGGVATLLFRLRTDDSVVACVRVECKAQGPSRYTERGAILAWNRRKA